MTSLTTHLGHPIVFSYKDRTQAYNLILHKFMTKLTRIKSNKLNHAGRITYINSVLASIPIYYMQNILFSKTFTKKINSILRCFWWQGVQDEDSSKPFHFRSWDDICQPKELEVWELEIYIMLTKVWFFTLLGWLPLIRIVFSHLFSKPNTFTILLFGNYLSIALGQPSGPPSFRLSSTCISNLLFRFTLATQIFGQTLSLRGGKTFMIS
jgi:hypothetical protein